jgi:hypothetical protein
MIILLLLFSCFELFSQKYFNNWYFGSHSGISFNTKTGEPEVLLDGAMLTYEGCSTISDREGNLLFYTDGVTVWNRLNKIMTNGEGLFGEKSSSQSALIVPKPGANNIFYIFTVYADIDMINLRPNSKGFNYSIVDLSLEKGMGAVTEKNTHLLDSTTERLAAVGHGNGKDIWIVTQDIKEKCFMAYLLTENGLGKYPVKSPCNINFDKYQAGIMKFSPDGKKLIFTFGVSKNVFAYNFNNATGDISKEINFPIPNGEPYGLEYSNNNQFIYVSSNINFSDHLLYQYDITSLDSTKIKNSENLIFELRNGNNFWALQAGPNNKIYMVRNSQYLSVIHQPNQPGSACNFILDELYLEGKMTMLGLPSFIQNYNSEIHVNDLTFCEGDSLFLIAPFYSNAVVDWTGPSGFVSSVYNPVINDSKQEMSGTYFYKISRNGNTIFDGTIKVVVSPRAKILFSEIKELTLCQDSLELIAVSNPDGFKFTWIGIESKENKAVIKSSGVYTVYVENQFGCIDSSTISININKPPVAKIISDNGTILCPNTNLHLSANEDFAQYKWSTGETSKEIVINSAGYYYLVIVDENGCKDSTGILINKVGNNISFSEKEHDFGTIKSGNLVSFTLTIENHENLDITIKDIFIKNNSNQFNLIHPDLPFVITSKGKIDISVNFVPKFEFTFTDSLVVISEPCSLVNNIKLSGKSEGKILVDFWLPDTTAEIGTDNFSLPIYIQLREKSNISFTTNIKTKIKFLRALYMTDTLTNGNFSKQIMYDTSSFNIEFKDVNISNEINNFSNFLGYILQTKDGFTNVIIENLEFSDRDLIPATKDGSIKTNPVCIPNLKGFKFREGSFISLKYDKLQGSQAIAFCGEKGDYSISIYTVAGELVYSVNWYTESKSEKYFKLSDIISSSGLYFIVLKSVDGIDIQKVPVIK